MLGSSCIDLEASSTQTLRSMKSSGSLHPTRACLLARRTLGWHAGDPDKHALELRDVAVHSLLDDCCRRHINLTSVLRAARA